MTPAPAHRRRSLPVALVVAAIGVAIGAPGAYAVEPEPVPSDSGDLVIVNPANVEREIDSGGSAVPFTFRMPEGASCPGDSANDDWRVQGFMIPATDDPTDVVFTVNDPEGEGQWALYGVDTRPYVDQLLLQNETAGQPGRFDAIPPLSFGVFSPGLLEPGQYRLGIACTYVPRRMDRYWDVVIDVIDDPDDEPARFRWAVAGAAGPAADAVEVGGFRRWSIVLAVTLVAGSLAFFVQIIQPLRRVRRGREPAATDAPAITPRFEETP